MPASLRARGNMSAQILWRARSKARSSFHISQRCLATATAPVRESNHNLPFRMAVIGSGPAGFYTAMGLMGKMPHAKVDMYEALPVPFGLVRFGIAPDHPEIEQTSHEKFGKAASSPNFTFIGNVTVGGQKPIAPGSCQVSLATILRHYDAVTFAYGAAQDKVLGIPGESLKGVYSARQFVGWYNGFPESSEFDPTLDAGEEAVIIGHGNVALDVARILLKSPDQLKATDIAEEAIDWLSRSRIKRVRVVGRRGPMQAAFTTAEVRALLRLPGVDFDRIREDLIPPRLLKMDKRDVAKKFKKYGRLAKTMIKGKGTFGYVEPAERSWSLDFCLAPKEFHGSPTNSSVVGTTSFERTVLSSIADEAATATGTGEFVRFNSSVVFRSIGYKSFPLQGFAEAGIPFDQRRGVINNDGMGRVLSEETGKPIPGLYCSGWIKTGPTGVVAHTMAESHATASNIAKDSRLGLGLRSGDLSEKAAGWEGVKAETPGAHLTRVVGWDDWMKIDQAERQRGKAVGKPRLKFRTTTDMLSVLE